MIYTDDTQIADGRMPSVLAIGDSWFWYPVNNVLHEFESAVRPEYRGIMSIGYVGAKVAEYIPGGKYWPKIVRQLSADALHYYSVVLISGGGNDAVDGGFALKSGCADLDVCADCIDPARLDPLLDAIAANYAALIKNIAARFVAVGAEPPAIFLHTYDHPPVNGLGFACARSGALGPWITTAMNACGVRNDRAFREEVAALFIDRLQARLARLETPAVRCIQSVGSLDPAEDWANELHPTPHGFEKVVAKAWRPRLAEAGLCA